MNTNELVINLPNAPANAPANAQDSINAFEHASNVLTKAKNAKQAFGINIHPSHFADEHFAKKIGEKLHHGYMMVGTPY
jgi:hypothetical protein